MDSPVALAGQPRNAALPVPADLSEAAQRALDVDPAAIVRAWLAGVADGTRRAYARALRSFTSWVLPQAGDDLAALRLLCDAKPGQVHSLLTTWRDKVLLPTLAPGTTSAMLSALASLLRTARNAGLTTNRPERLAPRGERVQDRSGPNRAQVLAILAVVDGAALAGDPRGLRDAAVLRLMVACGLRRSEVAELHREHVDVETGTVQPRRKGNRQRTGVTVSERTRAALAAWLRWRGDDAGPLFFRLDRRQPAEARRPMSGEAIRLMLRARAAEAGIESVVRPHGCRHHGATWLASNGASIAEVQAWGQWRSLSAMAGYLDQTAAQRASALRLADA